jgi:hypothetical protein
MRRLAPSGRPGKASGMQTFRTMRCLLPCSVLCTALPAVVASTDALADEVIATAEPATAPRTVGAPALFDCMVFSMSACPWSIVFELGLGVGNVNVGDPAAGVPEKNWFAGRVFTALGFVAQPVAGSNLHLGPVLEFGVEPSEFRTSWTLSPNLRARWFPLAGHPGRAFVVESALGLQLEHFGPTKGWEALESGTRLGPMAELAFGWRGIIGPWTQFALLEDPFDGHGRELRFFAGMRFNLGLFAVVGGSSGSTPIPSPRP